MTPAASALGWIGRQSSPLFFVAVFAGVLLPPLARLLQPLLLPAILLPFVVALVRLDLAALGRQARRPWLALGLVLWSLVGCPFLVALVLQSLPLDPDIAADGGAEIGLHRLPKDPGGACALAQAAHRLQRTRNADADGAFLASLLLQPLDHGAAIII